MDFEGVDPAQRRRPRPQLSRRRRAAGDLLAGRGHRRCTPPGRVQRQVDGAVQPGRQAPYPLARPDDPVTLPIKDSNPPIEDGLGPETGGVFQILNYDSYMAPGVMKAFGAKYDVDVQVTPYNNYDEMLSKIRDAR